MRSVAQKIASPACRSLHTSSTRITSPALHTRGPTTPSSRPLACQFSRTSAPFLPTRRSFFTSNILLQEQAAAGTEAPAAEPQPQQEHKHSPKPTTPKHKGAVAPKSGRRVASIAQKPRGRPVIAVPAAAAAAVTEPRHVRAASADDAEDYSTKISAVCVAGGFDMAAVADILSMHGFALDPDATGFDQDDMVHARAAGNGGDLFVFPTGTVVGWALPPDAVAALAARQLLSAAEEPHVARSEEEDLEFELDPSSERSYIRGDKVVLGSAGLLPPHAGAATTASVPNTGGAAGSGAGSSVETGDVASRARRQQELTLAKVAFSAGLARSTKLAVLESSLAAYIESTRPIPLQLSRGGPFRLSRRFVLQKTGELVLLRAQLNHQGELTDTLPDMLWDSRAELGLDTHYARICRALDVDLRIEVLNDKVTYANEVAGVLREIASQKHSSRLEWIIIALIAVEVLVEFRRMYMEHVAEQPEAVAALETTARRS